VTVASGPGVLVREARADDAPGIARIGLENARLHVRLAPELFRVPDEDGLVEFIADDADWREDPANLALVAEVDGRVAGYLEASVQPPLESARWQSQQDLGELRLLINYVGTGEGYKRRGVATSLVDAAEAWGSGRGAKVAVCDTWIDSPMSVPFWEERMGYQRRAIIFRKPLV
jgi:ribosomal protein S18 acetylase RimI-like enzyme